MNTDEHTSIFLIFVSLTILALAVSALTFIAYFQYGAMRHVLRRVRKIEGNKERTKILITEDDGIPVS